MEKDNVFSEKDAGDFVVASTENAELQEKTLEDCFKCIVEGNSVEFDIENLTSILNKDLQVYLNCLKPKLKYVLPFMLVHFIKCWPGWQRTNNYLNKQITFEAWFKKFKEYLVFKLNYLIKNDFDKVQNMVKTNSIEDNILFKIASKIDNSTQIDIPLEKPVSPYTIEVQGPPKILNSLIFCEGTEGDILVRDFKTIPFVEKLTMKQLLNWPHVEVFFMSKELHFKRTNMHEYKRYLMFNSEKITFKRIETLIEECKIINEKLTRQAYSLNVLKEYFHTYVRILEMHQKVAKLSDEYIADIKATLDEFIADIVQLNMNSMATNTSVLFNIGNVYARNKSVRTSCFNIGNIYARNKSVRTSGQAVSFAESITPKVNISLFKFIGIENKNCDTPFQGLQNLVDSQDKEYIQSFLPVIKFRCTYCDKIFKKKDNFFLHFKTLHCMEQPVLCFKCKLQMEVVQICENRWRHQCRPNNIVRESK